jgi:hypothetical protein
MNELADAKKGRNTLFLDMIFYIILPYFIWHYGKDSLGTYYAILFSTVPSIIYAFYRFFKDKQFNFTGVFLVVSLVLKSVVDILSGGAEQMLLNQCYLLFVLAFLLLITVLIKKPLGLYFFADMSQLFNLDRDHVLSLCREKKMFRMLNMLTILYIIRYIATGLIKLWLIHAYGVEGYGKMIIIMQIENWVFTIIMGVYTFKIIQKLQPKIA